MCMCMHMCMHMSRPFSFPCFRVKAFLQHHDHQPAKSLFDVPPTCSSTSTRHRESASVRYGGVLTRGWPLTLCPGAGRLSCLVSGRKPITWVTAAWCSRTRRKPRRPLRVNSNVSFANADPFQHGAAAPVASRRPLRVNSNVPSTFSERCRKPSWVTACRHARTGLCRMDFRRKPGRVTACRHARKGLCQRIRCCLCSC